MSVRAKFKLTKVESTFHFMPVPGQDKQYHNVEMRTLILNPVYSPDVNSENRKFWDASPAGELRLGTVNPEAWSQFELGKGYYLDFTEAPAE